MESQKATKQGRILRNYHCYAFTDYHIPTFLDIFQPPTHHSPYTCHSHIQSHCNTSQHTIQLHYLSQQHALYTQYCSHHHNLLCSAADCSCSHLMQTIFAQARPTMPCICLVAVITRLGSVPFVTKFTSVGWEKLVGSPGGSL